MAEHERPRRVLLGTLRSRLVALALVSAIPALALLVYAMRTQYQEARQSIETRELAACHAAAAPEQALVDRGHALLSLMATLPVLRHPAACQPFLRQLLRAHPLYVNFGVTDAQGMVRCSAVPLPHPVSLANRPYFAAARHSGHFSLGGYEVGRISGRRLFVLAQPSHRHGRFAGVVLGAVGLRALGRFDPVFGRDVLLHLEPATRTGTGENRAKVDAGRCSFPAAPNGARHFRVVRADARRPRGPCAARGTGHVRRRGPGAPPPRRRSSGGAGCARTGHVVALTVQVALRTRSDRSRPATTSSSSAGLAVVGTRVAASSTLPSPSASVTMSRTG